MEFQGGGNADSGITIRYFNIKALIDMASSNNLWSSFAPILGVFTTVKGLISNEHLIQPYIMWAEGYRESIYQGAIIEDFLFVTSSNNTVANVDSATVINAILQQGCFEITKEEFYDLTN